MMSTSGLLKQLENKYFSAPREIKYRCSSNVDYTAHSISLEESTVMFIILGVGMGVALFELLVEVFVKYIRRCWTVYNSSFTLPRQGSNHAN